MHSQNTMAITVLVRPSTTMPCGVGVQAVARAERQPA